MAEREQFEIEEPPKAVDSSKGIPKITLIVLCVIEFVQGMNLLMVMVILPYLVAWYLGPSASDHQVSVYSGILGAGYSASKIFGSYPLGLLSDRYGRKPFLVLGLTVMLMVNLVLIINKSFWIALIMRLIWGLLVETTPLIFSYVTENTNQEKRTKIFMIMVISTLWGVIVTPMVSGGLSRPNDRFGWESSFFAEYQYALPFIVLSAVAGITLLLTIIFLKETKSNEETVQLLENPQQAMTLRQSLKLMAENRVYVGALIAQVCIQFVHASNSETIAIWARTSQDNGGLGWEDEAWMGMVIFFGATCILICNISSGTCIIPKFGSRNTNVISNYCIVPLVLFSVFSRSFPTKFGSLVYMIISHWAYVAFYGLSMMASSLLINNCIDKRILGSGNWVTSGIASLSRAIAGVVTGQVIGWTITNGLSFPFNYSFPFLIQSMVALIAAVVGGRLTKGFR